jgi:hypothetical protein
MWQEQNNPYGASSSYYPNQQSQDPLQFYAQPHDYYASSRPSLDGQVQGSMGPMPAGFGGNIQSQGPWWTAFGTGGFEGEPPLLEGKHNAIPWVILYFIFLNTELGINFAHIRDKSMAVLNPLSRVDEHIMDDADLAGPVFYCFCFGICLLLVCSRVHVHVFIHLICSAVRKIKLQLHLWCRPRRFGFFIYPLEFNV